MSTPPRDRAADAVAVPAPTGGGGGDLRAAGRRAVSYGWMPLLAIASTQFLEAGERQALAQAFSGIQEEFGVADSMLGLLATIMAVTGGLGAIPVGYLADRIRRTWLLAGAVAIWTVTIGVSGFATSFAMLFGVRMLLGAVEANNPAAVSLISDYYPVRQRARMMGLFQGGALIGALVGLAGGGIAVQLGGWRWAAYMWVPFGVLAAIWLLRTPEPARGEQDADFDADLRAADAAAVRSGADALTVVTGVEQAHLSLPPPRRVGALDYARAGPGEVIRELLRIRTMWVALIGLGVAQMLLTGLQAWGVEFFKRVHDLEAAAAGGLMGALGLSSAIGIIGGGFLADRLLRGGLVNARVWVSGVSAIAATFFMVPAFATDTLLVSAPFMVLGGIALTLSVGPIEAMFNDVVVPQLRGRAATLRSLVRSLGTVAPFAVGAISDQIGLQNAILVLTPASAVGGVFVLFALRDYRYELSFVVAETRRHAAERTET